MFSIARFVIVDIFEAPSFAGKNAISFSVHLMFFLSRSRVCENSDGDVSDARINTSSSVFFPLYFFYFSISRECVCVHYNTINHLTQKGRHDLFVHIKTRFALSPTTENM